MNCHLRLKILVIVLKSSAIEESAGVSAWAVGRCVFPHAFLSQHKNSDWIAYPACLVQIGHASQINGAKYDGWWDGYMHNKGFRETTKFILLNTSWQDSLKYGVTWLNLPFFIFHLLGEQWCKWVLKIHICIYFVILILKCTQPENHRNAGGSCFLLNGHRVQGYAVKLSALGSLKGDSGYSFNLCFWKIGLTVPTCGGVFRTKWVSMYKVLTWQVLTI